MNTTIPSHVGSTLNKEIEVAKALMESVSPAVSIYGSARIKREDPYYQKTLELAKSLSDRGISVISGGGPGIMAAANEGAQQGAHGLSVGLNIRLPHEQKPNDYQDVTVMFNHFSSRKVTFCKYSLAFIVMPGGVGTLDELFEVVTLIQCGKTPDVPVILYGKEFWSGLLSWLESQVLGNALINKADFDKLILVDSVEEVIKLTDELFKK